MYAVIKTGGKQYQVKEGDILFIEKLDKEELTEIDFTDVLLVGEDGKVTVGDPTVKGAKVTAKVLKNGKARKITVFTYKAKKNEKRKMGHRQPYTKVQILTIKAS